MRRCRKRSPTREQRIWIEFVLTRGVIVAGRYDRAPFDQMVRISLLEFVNDNGPFREYRVTEEGAAAIGLELPQDRTRRLTNLQ